VADQLGCGSGGPDENGSAALPTHATVLQSLGTLVEIARDAERMAADARIYGPADDARLLVDEILRSMLSLGAQIPEGYSLSESAPEGEPAERTLGELEDLSQIGEDLARFVEDVQEVTTDVVETLAESSASSADRKLAGCLNQRLNGYYDLRSDAERLREGIASMNSETQDVEDQQQLRDLERELDMTNRLMEGCRRGAVEALRSAQAILQSLDEDGEAAPLVEIARDIIEDCN
jgi:hypothetical protein